MAQGKVGRVRVREQRDPRAWQVRKVLNKPTDTW